jgi:hypothetical protein
MGSFERPEQPRKNCNTQTYDSWKWYGRGRQMQIFAQLMRVRCRRRVAHCRLNLPFAQTIPAGLPQHYADKDKSICMTLALPKRLLRIFAEDS